LAQILQNHNIKIRVLHFWNRPIETYTFLLNCKSTSEDTN